MPIARSSALEGDVLILAVVTLTTEQLHWILDGIDIDAMVRDPVRQYQVAG